MAAIQGLRYRYFVTHKKWITRHSLTPGYETDRYDSDSHHLAVFEEERLLGYLRALPWGEDTGFMLDHEFRCLVPDEEFSNLHRQNSLEISRLVLTPDLSADVSFLVTELLFKLLYYCCLEQQIEHLYAVVEVGWLRRFKSCFHLPFQPLGASQRFPDGTRTVAIHAGVRELEQSLRAAVPQKLRWYQQR